MQKYIKNDFSEIRYFKDDVKVSDWIDLKEYRLMTKAEILKHETLRPTEFHTIWVWDNEPSAGHWEDGRTEEENLHISVHNIQNLHVISLCVAYLKWALSPQTSKLKSY